MYYYLSLNDADRKKGRERMKDVYFYFFLVTTASS